MMLNGNSWPERLYSPSIVVFANFPFLPDLRGDHNVTMLHSPEFFPAHSFCTTGATRTMLLPAVKAIVFREREVKS
jgi:hypothetical protein